MAAGGALAWGRRVGAGLRAGGAAAFGGPGAFRPPGQPNKRAGPGPLAPGPALSGRAAPSRRPPWGAPSFLRPWVAPPYDRRRCAGAGEVGGAVGVREGRRRFAGPKGPQNQSRGRGQRPPPMLCARCARPPPPLGRWLFSVLSGKAPVLSLQFPANKTSPPLPMSGGPAYSVGNQKKFSSWFSPAFFKSGPGGVGGWQPPT